MAFYIKPITVSSKDTAVVLVDLQNDYHTNGGALYVGPLADQATPHIKVLIEKAKAAGAPIIFTKNVFEKNDPAYPAVWRDLWPPLGERGGWGEKIIDELAPMAQGRGVHIIEKKWYGAFEEPAWGMDAKLKQLGIKNIIIGGTCTNICVLHTANGASQKGYRVIVANNCCATISPYDQEVGIHQMIFCYNAFPTIAEWVTFS